MTPPTPTPHPEGIGNQVNDCEEKNRFDKVEENVSIVIWEASSFTNYFGTFATSKLELVQMIRRAWISHDNNTRHFLCEHAKCCHVISYSSFPNDSIVAASLTV